MIIDFEKVELIDLTHAIDQSIASWEEGCGFESEITWGYSNSTEETQFRIQSFHMRE